MVRNLQRQSRFPEATMTAIARHLLFLLQRLLRLLGRRHGPVARHRAIAVHARYAWHQ